MKESKKHCFYLDESGYLLDEVVVTYQDIKKLFKKNTKRIPALNYNCTMNANFDAKFIDPEQKVYPASGTLEATNEWISKNLPYGYYGWFHHPFQFITDSDTAKIRYLLHSNTHTALNFINLAIVISLLDDYGKGKLKAFYSYLGMKDNFKIFRISYPKTFSIGYSYQILLYVDEYTKYIHHVEFEAVNTDSDKDKYLSKVNIICDCELYTNKKPPRPTVLLPVNINYKAQMFDGSQMEIKLSNISIKYKN
ncbi:MAG: hypothetical protein Q8N38_10770 [Bacteroidales bacterium]|nr:hypothetical protein [Bacteroidales bacterium]